MKSSKSKADKKITRSEIEKSLRTGETPERMKIQQILTEATNGAMDEKAVFDGFIERGGFIKFSKNGAPIFSLRNGKLNFSRTTLGLSTDQNWWKNDNQAGQNENEFKQTGQPRSRPKEVLGKNPDTRSRTSGDQKVRFRVPAPRPTNERMEEILGFVESSWTKKSAPVSSVTSTPVVSLEEFFIDRQLTAWRSKKTAKIWYYDESQKPTGYFADENGLHVKSEFLTRERAVEMLSLAAAQYAQPLEIAGNKQFVEAIKKAAQELEIKITVKETNENEKNQESPATQPQRMKMRG